MKAGTREEELENLVGNIGQTFLGPDGQLRPLPRPQIRSACADRILSIGLGRGRAVARDRSVPAPAAEALGRAGRPSAAAAVEVGRGTNWPRRLVPMALPSSPRLVPRRSKRPKRPWPRRRAVVEEREKSAAERRQRRASDRRPPPRPARRRRRVGLRPAAARHAGARPAARPRARTRRGRRTARRWPSCRPSRCEDRLALGGTAMGFASAPPQYFHVLRRGSFRDLGEVVAPRGFRCLATLPADWGLAARRARDRAAAAAGPVDHRSRNPLPARVIVNRLWHYHFGVGLVDTPSDFGFNGGRPSHPELLDRLAADLVEHGWSLKAHAAPDRAVGHLSAIGPVRSRRRPRSMPAIGCCGGARRSGSMPNRCATRCWRSAAN